jgi:prepilin-type N-terminal cleavage/methylation domain-containing protein
MPLTTAHQQHNPPSAPAKRAFTLVELLVVIGIIGLLVAILLPSLNKARRAGNTIACLANMRSIGQALTMYCAQNNGYIPGSGNTTGKPLWNIASGGNIVQASIYHEATGTNGPITIRGLGNLTVIQPEDWIGPLSIVMGLPLPVGEDGRPRFVAYCNLPQFQCPEYTTALWTPGSSGDASQGAQPAFSYCAALGFMVTSFIGGHGAGTGWPGTAGVGGSPYFVIPSTYFPKITKIGKTSQKIYAADGNRITFTYPSGATPNLHTPTYVLSTDPVTINANTNIFADYGVPFGDSHAWDLTADPVNISSSGFKPGFDARSLSFRHGSTLQFGPQGAYYLNAVFYDGHAETINDVDASNPNLWLPAGTILNSSNLSGTLQSATNESILYYSAQKKYGLSSSMSGNWTAQ